jgi:hypothetical protein
MENVLQKKPSKTFFRDSSPYIKKLDLPNYKLLMVPKLELNICLVSHDAYYRNQKRTSNHL